MCEKPPCLGTGEFNLGSGICKACPFKAECEKVLDDKLSVDSESSKRWQQQRKRLNHSCNGLDGVLEWAAL